MAIGGGEFYTYPWGASSASATMQINYSSGTNPVYYYPTITYDASPSPVLPEGPMEWLRRRVTEVTDLAYAA